MRACRFSLLFVVACLNACATQSSTELTGNVDNAMAWVARAAEFRAVATQAYVEAERDLPAMIADGSWSALPGIEGDPGKPPAIILDMDETVVSNYDFQAHHLPYTAYKHYTWNRDNRAEPVPGAVEFLKKAQAAGVTAFFVTNRPCERVVDSDEDCPQKAVSLQDLLEVGVDTDLDHVLLANERPDWTKEKITRRRHVAETHRVIMLFGDDLSDFVSCVREKVTAPCRDAGSASSRQAAVDRLQDYWGEGWYILPNPMHGSWTNFLE